VAIVSPPPEKLRHRERPGGRRPGCGRARPELQATWGSALATGTTSTNGPEPLEYRSPLRAVGQRARGQTTGAEHGDSSPQAARTWGEPARPLSTMPGGCSRHREGCRLSWVNGALSFSSATLCLLAGG
jgi:hypothetical protein